MVPYALGEELAEAVGADGVVAVDSASHILPLTHPETIAKAIKAC